MCSALMPRFFGAPSSAAFPFFAFGVTAPEAMDSARLAIRASRILAMCSALMPRFFGASVVDFSALGWAGRPGLRRSPLACVVSAALRSAAISDWVRRLRLAVTGVLAALSGAAALGFGPGFRRSVAGGMAARSAAISDWVRRLRLPGRMASIILCSESRFGRRVPVAPSGALSIFSIRAARGFGPGFRRSVTGGAAARSAAIWIWVRRVRLPSEGGSSIVSPALAALAARRA